MAKTGDTPEIPKPIEARNEVILAEARQDALNAIVNEGIASAYTSQVHQTDKGTQIVTTSAKDHSTKSILVTGSATQKNYWFTSTPHEVAGEFTIDHQNGSKQEHVEYSRNYDFSDNAANHKRASNLALRLTDAEGRETESYEPAVVDGPNDAIVQLSKPANGSDNCDMENPYNPTGNRRDECDFILHDAKLGTLRFNQSIYNNEPNGNYYRTVVRDNNGNPIAVLEQTFHTDSRGNLSDVKTTARRPDFKELARQIQEQKEFDELRKK